MPNTPREFVDQYLGQLSPEELAQVREYQKQGVGLNSKAVASPPDAVVKLLATKFGWSPQAAKEFAVTAAGAFKNNDGWADKPLDDTFKAWVQRSGINAAAPGTSPSGQGQGQEPTDYINDQLNKLYQQYSGPVGPNDQIATTLSGFGGAEAAKMAAARGLTGGISGASAQQGAQNAVLPYLQQRQQMAMGALTGLSSRDLAMRAQTLADLQARNQATAANYAAQQNQGANYGAILGGVGDALATAYGYPTGGALSKLGAGVGGTFAGSVPQMSGVGGYTGFTVPQSGAITGGYKPNGGAF